MISSETSESPEDGSVAAPLAVVALIAGALAIVAAIWASPRAGFSVALGGVFALLNLWLIARIVRAFLGGSSNRLSWGLVTLFKFTGMFAALYFLFKSGLVEVLPVVIGYGALPLGIVASQLQKTQGLRHKG